MRQRRTGAPKVRIPALVLLCALLVFLFTNLISWVFFRHIPHIHDEIAYLFQAKIFAQGRLSVASPCGNGAFAFPHMINNGRWYSQYPPGYPLILLAGLIAGMPWIINPLLAALAVIVLYFLGKEIYGEEEGRSAAVFGTISIWFLLTSSTMLSHTSSMVAFSLFLLYLYRSFHRPTFGNGLMAGLALGFALLIRPYNIAWVALPFLAIYGWRSLADKRSRFSNFAGFASVLILAAGVLMLYNTLTNGRPLTMGYIVSHGEEHGLGFGRQGYLGIPHTPERGLLLIGENLGAINDYLFGWPVTSLLFLIPFFIPSRGRKGDREADLLLASGVLSLTLGLFFYWGSVVFFGPRMYFEAWPLLILMTARGLAKTPALARKLLPSCRPPSARRAALVIIGALTVYGFAWTFPRWVKPGGTEAFNRVLVRDFSGTTPRINDRLAALPLGRSLVIMKFLYAPKRHFPDGWWSSGFLYDDPGLKNRMIYAQDRGAANIELFRCYPDRKIYLFYGTLAKGMLFPLELKDGQIQYGPPITAASRQGDAFKLVSESRDLFFCYSRPFQSTLEAAFEKYGVAGVDVVRLTDLAEQAERDGDPAPAAYLREAALQIENDPEARMFLLAGLARLYNRNGRSADARRIQTALAPLTDSRIYHILPEKGF